MPKEKMVYFRTSLGGFNREDVNSYIEKLNGEFAERERTAKRKTDALESKLAELENAKSELERALARASALETAAAEREKLIAEQLARIEEQNRTIDALRRERGEAQSRAESLDERLASLSDAIAKSEKYDDVSAQIGEIILSAKSTADEIIEAAKREADDMRRTADEQLENAAASFNARAATAAYAVKSQIKKNCKRLLFRADGTDRADRSAPACTRREHRQVLGRAGRQAGKRKERCRSRYWRGSRQDLR